MTLEEILNTPIIGNAYHDRALMDKIHSFVSDENNLIEERLQALRHLDKVMGITDTQPYPTLKDLEEYLSKA